MKKVTVPNTLNLLELTAVGLRQVKRKIEAGSDIKIGEEETRSVGGKYHKVVKIIGTIYYGKVDDLDPIRHA
jgi:hypothetical protein